MGYASIALYDEMRGDFGVTYGSLFSYYVIIELKDGLNGG